MPSSPPITPSGPPPPTRGPESNPNLIHTSTDEETPYEAAYNTHRTGGPGNVILTEEERRNRMGTFSGGSSAAGGGSGAGSGAGNEKGTGVQQTQTRKTQPQHSNLTTSQKEKEDLGHRAEIAGSGGNYGAETVRPEQ